MIDKERYLSMAKELVLSIEQDRDEQTNSILAQMSAQNNEELYNEVGKLTRKLHESISSIEEIGIGERVGQWTQVEIPDAKARLNYVIQITEDAANSTMDAIERCLPHTQKIGEKLEIITPAWRQLMSGEIPIKQFKSLCADIDELFQGLAEGNQQLNASLQEVLTTQSFQDLAGQTLKKIISLVIDIEAALIELLKLFGEPHVAAKTEPDITPEGPIVDPKNRSDVVNNQDDVDDLLSSLGF